MRINRKVQIVFFLQLIMLIVGFETACNAERLIENEKKPIDLTVFIPIEGNSWVIDDLEKNEEIIKSGGIKNWKGNETQIRTYFKTTHAGKLNVGILATAIYGFSKIKVTCGSKSETIEINNLVEETISVGTFEIDKAGYHFIEIQGVEKTGEFFPEIKSIVIGGKAAEGKVYFARDDFYWGRSC